MTRKREQESVKRDEITGYIRRRIMSGEWNEGMHLPPRTWFGKQFDAAPLTVQRAFQVLLDEKILVAKERIGTRVADHLPNPARFALLLYGTRETIVYHTMALVEAGKRLAEKGWIVEPHFILDRYPDEIMSSSVFADLQKQYYAGAFFEADGRWSSPGFWKRLEAVPVSGFLSPKHPGTNILPCREKKSDGGVLSDMLEHLAMSGAHKVIRIVSETDFLKAREDAFCACAARYGLECPPGSYLSMPHQITRSGQLRNVIRNLFAPDRTAMPDALILHNESFLPEICGVLREFYGEQAPRLVRIASIANYPALPDVDYPVSFYGYDMVRTLENAFHAMMDMRRGKKVKFPDAVFFDNVNEMQKERYT